MKKREKNKSHLILIGSFLILMGISLICGKHLYSYLTYKEEEQIINDFLETEIIEVQENTVTTETQETPKQTTTPYNYIGVLEIPTINFKKGFLNINDKNNNVDKNIEVLKNSDMPNVANGLLAIAGHSGNSKVGYFNKLSNLKRNDLVYVYYNNIKYTYEITSIERQLKQGYITFTKTNDTKELILTTCDQKDKTKQIVIIAKVINEENY